MTIQAAIVGIFFVSMGGMALLSPNSIVMFFGIKAETSAFRNEIRAVYGGFGVALGTLLLISDRFLDGYKEGIFLTCSIALFGMAGGRVLSLLLERTGRWPIIFLCVEVIGGTILITAV